MIVNSLKKTFKTMLLKPQIFFPMIVATIVSLLSMNITNFVLERPLTEMLYHLDVFMTSDFATIFITRYWFELIVMLISGFFVLFVTSISFISLARFVKKNSVIDAINDSVIELQKAISLTVLLFLVGFIAFILFQGFLFLLNLIYAILPSEINYYLQLFVAPILLLIIFIVITTKVIFVVPAIIEEKLKSAIKKSWEFTDDKFWNVFLYIIIVLFFTIIIMSLFTSLGVLFELDFVLAPIGELISMTFLGLAISFYFFE